MQKVCDSLEFYALEHLDEQRASELKLFIPTPSFKKARKSEQSYAKQVKLLRFPLYMVFNFTYFAWARTPITSAYKSATMCIFPVLGPRYLARDKKEFLAEKASCLNHYNSKIQQIIFFIEFLCEKEPYPSLYLKCLKARLITSCTKLSITGWSGIWKHKVKHNQYTYITLQAAYLSACITPGYLPYTNMISADTASS